jgi:hypothetical protein
VRFGDLRQLEPVSRDAQSRGTPIHEHYAAAFLASHRDRMAGRVLRAGGPGEQRLPEKGGGERYDCVVCRGALEAALDPSEAVDRIAGVLTEEGAALVPLAGMGAPASGDAGLWSFTPASARRLFEARFERVEVVSLGNVRAAAAAIQGVAAEELPAASLEKHDPDYPVVVGVVAERGRRR